MGYNFITNVLNSATNQNLAKSNAVQPSSNTSLKQLNKISVRKGANMPQFSLCIQTHSHPEHFSL